MHICFLIQWLKAGGAERTVVNLANYFVQENNVVDIVMLGDRVDYDVDERVNLFTIDKFSGPEGFSAFKRIRIRRQKFNQYIGDNHPEIIVSLLAPMLVYLKNIKIPIIGSERSNPISERGFIKRKITEYLYSKADRIIFQTNRVSECFPKSIREKSVVIGNPIGNIYNGKKYLFNERANRISAMGRLVPAKDYPTLLKAFAIVLKTHPLCRLDIYGEGSLKQDLIDLATELKIEKSVNFCGFKKDSLQLIADSKCYVLSSVYEGLPNSLLEAMAAGIPCVSTDCKFGPNEIIEDKVNGLLVPSSNEIKLSEAINTFLDNEELSNICALNATKIIETYSLENICEQYKVVFKDTLKKYNGESNDL